MFLNIFEQNRMLYSKGISGKTCFFSKKKHIFLKCFAKEICTSITFFEKKTCFSVYFRGKIDNNIFFFCVLKRKRVDKKTEKH